MSLARGEGVSRRELEVREKIRDPRVGRAPRQTSRPCHHRGVAEDGRWWRWTRPSGSGRPARPTPSPTSAGPGPEAFIPSVSPRPERHRTQPAWGPTPRPCPSPLRRRRASLGSPRRPLLSSPPRVPWPQKGPPVSARSPRREACRGGARETSLQVRRWESRPGGTEGEASGVRPQFPSAWVRLSSQRGGQEIQRHRRKTEASTSVLHRHQALSTRVSGPKDALPLADPSPKDRRPGGGVHPHA